MTPPALAPIITRALAILARGEVRDRALFARELGVGPRRARDVVAHLEALGFAERVEAVRITPRGLPLADPQADPEADPRAAIAANGSGSGSANGNPGDRRNHPYNSETSGKSSGETPTGTTSARATDVRPETYVPSGRTDVRSTRGPEERTTDDVVAAIPHDGRPVRGDDPERRALGAKSAWLMAALGRTNKGPAAVFVAVFRGAMQPFGSDAVASWDVVAEAAVRERATPPVWTPASLLERLDAARARLATPAPVAVVAPVEAPVAPELVAEAERLADEDLARGSTTPRVVLVARHRSALARARRPE